jgi:carbonic anhydrase
MRILNTIGLAGLLVLGLAGGAPAGEKSTVSAVQAETLLQEGSQRFVKAYCTTPPKQGSKCLADVGMRQAPFAVVVTCSDCRVPPELIFDQGLGDLFIVRLAGNIVNDAVLGSIEYAVDHLGVPLVVVLGHKRCGAVVAAVEAVEGKQPAPGHLPSLVKALKPAVEKTRSQAGDRVDNAVHANIRLVAETIKTAKPILAPAVKAGKVKVLGAYYDLDDGKVTFLK